MLWFPGKGIRLTKQEKKEITGTSRHVQSRIDFEPKNGLRRRIRRAPVYCLKTAHAEIRVFDYGTHEHFRLDIDSNTALQRKIFNLVRKETKKNG